MITVMVDASQFRQGIRNLSDALGNFRPFWDWWWPASSEPIQRDWFYAGGPDQRPLAARTIAARSRGLRFRNPGAASFYQAIQAGEGKAPQGNVDPSGPRWVWSKNTLRSTYRPARFDRQGMDIDTERRFDLEGGPRYPGDFAGPFVRFMPQQNLWDIGRLDRDLDSKLGVYAEFRVSGRPLPRIQGVAR